MSEKHEEEKKKEESVAEESAQVESEGCEHCQEYKQGWQRALADYKNLQQDLIKQKDQARKQIKIAFVHDLLPVMDNFAQAINHAPDDLPKQYETWLQGVRFIDTQFVNVLTSLGAERIEVGDEFDPHLHEAVGEGEEMQEVRSGWKIGEQVIRPAQVIVKEDAS